MTVVLVHGAFHGPWCWDLVVDELRREGIDVAVVDLPFTGFDDDVVTTRTAIESAGSGTVVCCHSYGGVVTDRALVGLTGVSRIVYVAALINTGTDLFADGPPPIVQAIVPHGDMVRFEGARAGEIFYADSDKDTVDRIVPLLRPMVLDITSFLGEPPPRPSARSAYLVCTGDAAVPVTVQRRLAMLCDEQVEWPTDHSPFLTRPAELARFTGAGSSN
jgi:hypothetical protein